MAQEAVADLSAPAYSKATLGLDALDVLAAEYSALLDTYCALLASGNIDAAAETIANGDYVAGQMATWGRRLAPWREAIESRKYEGPRASELVQRSGQALTRARQLAAAAARVEAVCLQMRDSAADGMRGIVHGAALVPSLVGAPYAPARTTAASALDTRG